MLLGGGEQTYMLTCVEKIDVLCRCLVVGAAEIEENGARSLIMKCESHYTGVKSRVSSSMGD